MAASSVLITATIKQKRFAVNEPLFYFETLRDKPLWCGENHWLARRTSQRTVLKERSVSTANIRYVSSASQQDGDLQTTRVDLSGDLGL
ncbi:hypothetical protein GCM10011273_04280 [Asticcacaulis endophyticus]|uniref:Uncharacterized protein n=1 Tax=Asticcacaulis endophyticus TaxID=1395890 RepID=A0A918PTV9_9CAUL|nr:hypothetical protein GCM10011273_04280 [Asticcacaulis endophyticus]